MNWYTIENIERIDTPCLVIYKERIKYNIDAAVKLIKQVNNLRPHVKTNKIAEVCRMMMDAGIDKFKCATISEAEMLAMTGAKDVLLAYQPTGPKAERLNRLTQHYPETVFSCLVDDADVASALSEVFARSGITLNVFIDINTGMNRTGIIPKKTDKLFDHLQSLPFINIAGIHFYDGHIRDADPEKRKENSDSAYKGILKITGDFEKSLGRKIKIIAGGSPTFPMHATRDVECSPGTFIFWDWGYKHQFPDEPFEYAALVVTRVVSVVNKKTITVDLGHKAIASENPLPRVYFLNAPGSKPVAHSEEHMVIEVPDASKFKPGDVLFGIPVHICPTVALYERAILVESNQATTIWRVIARDRMINF
ncbi:MAG TPA: D-TA family PLP-dependent enzyme [Flavitalea sp.]|nr:D-TA family PLP-dependent enzyme [Flavitalea sp.]